MSVFLNGVNSNDLTDGLYSEIFVSIQRFYVADEGGMKSFRDSDE